MEKIILVNAVETSSQPNNSEINEYGKVVKIAITDGQQVLFCPVVLAEVGERGKGMKKHAFIDFCKRSTVEERICERSLWQVVQTFERSLLIVPQDASLVLLLRMCFSNQQILSTKNQGANQT